MASFDAESKRASLTLRQAIGDDKGRLWVPARVTVTEGRVKISNVDGALEFKPLAICMEWTEQIRGLGY